MIAPLVLEDEWLAALKHLPVWDPPLLPLVVLATHPDDETLAVEASSPRTAFTEETL